MTLADLEYQLLSELKDKPLSQLHHILKQYDGNDWKNYIQFNDNKYNKIKIPSFLVKNDIFEIVIICWKKNQQSRIHDHPEHGCLLKLLTGKLEETRYNRHQSENSYFPTTTTIFEPTESSNTSYLCGKMGLHSIKALEDSVSLHIYSPVNYTPTYY